jgi:hypothetical protein
VRQPATAMQRKVSKSRKHMVWANDPPSATRRTGRSDGNRDAMAGFAAAHGQAASLS